MITKNIIPIVIITNYYNHKKCTIVYLMKLKNFVIPVNIVIYNERLDSRTAYVMKHLPRDIYSHENNCQISFLSYSKL